jgi:GAF domain-containing protein
MPNKTAEKAENSENPPINPASVPNSDAPEINLLEVYRRIMSSLDLQEVVIEITTLAKKMLEAATVSVALIAERKFIEVDHQGIIIQTDFSKHLNAFISGKGLGGQAYQAGEPICTSDYWNDPRIEHTSELDSRARRKQMVASMATPIKLDGQIVAMLWTNKAKVYNWTATDIALAEQFATLSGLAIHNASIYSNLDSLNNQLTARNAELEALQDFNRRLRGPLELKAACERALAVAIGKIGVRDGSLYLAKAENPDEIYLIVRQGFPENSSGIPAQLSLSQNFPSLILNTKQTMVISGETVLQNLKLKELIFPGQSWQSCLLVPLLVGDKLIGLINFGSAQPDHFTPEKVRFAEMMTHQISAAIQQITQLEIEKERAQLRVVLSLARTAASELDQPLALLKYEIEQALEDVDTLSPETLEEMQAAITKMTNLLREYQRLVRYKESGDLPTP